MAVNKNKIVAQAQRFAAKGQFEKAITEYRKLLNSDPSDIRTWLKLGDLYTRMGARKEATETYFRVAEQYTQSGFHLKAIAVYKQVLNLDPTLVVVHKYLASSYIELGLTSEALIQLEQLADIYQRTGKKELLLETLLQMGTIDSHNIATRLRIAELLSEENRVREATKHFAIACEELKAQGRQDDFIKVAARLFYHDSSRVDIAQEIAEAYIEKGQYKEALSKLQACFVKNPKDVAVLRLLADSFKGLAQPEKAISVLEEIYGLLTDADSRREIAEEILEITPGHSRATRWLHATASESPAPPAEMDAIPQAIDSEFLDNDAELSIAAPSESTEEQANESIQNRSKEMLEEVRVLLKYGMKDRALEHLQKIYDSDPYNFEARELNKDILLEMDKQEEALEHLFLLADVFKQSQPEGSVYYLHEILRIDPTNAQARQMIVDIGGIMPEGLSEDVSNVEEDPALLLDEDEDIVLIDDDDIEAANQLMADDDVAVEDIDDWVDVDSEPPLDDLDDVDDVIDLEDDNDTVSEDVDIIEETDLIVDDDDSMVEEEVVIEDDEPVAREATKEDAPEMSVSSDRAPLADIEDDLEELDFFISQELFDEAQGLLDELLAKHPDDPRLETLSDRLKREKGSDDAETDDAAGAENTAPSEDTESQEERPTDETPSTDEAAPPGEVEEDGPVVEIEADDPTDSHDDSVQFKNVGLQGKVSASDAATNWDLGLAYKEMGLFDDAIQAFKIAARDPSRTGAALTMIGACYVSLDKLDNALETFEQGLTAEIDDPQQKMGLLYELGKTYQMMKRPNDALQCYHKIYKIDKSFADIRSRIAALVGGKKRPATA